MAYAAVVSLAQTMHLILKYHQDIISPQLQHQVVSIQRFVNGILEASPQDFPHNMEGRLREAALAAEDAIEFQLSKHIHDSFSAPQKSKFKDIETGWQDHFQYLCARDCKSEHQTWNEYRHFRYDLHNLDKAAEEIELIADKIIEVPNCIRPGDSTSATSSTAATSHEDVMLGCDDDVMQIKSRLCGESSKLEVIPIVGMGGIGKTTLARNVYDDPLVMESFDIRAWVTVSQDYSVQEIIWNLLVSMNVFVSKKEETYAHHVYQHLKSRKYLIVLDDVWSTEAWDDLMMMFPDDGNGSRIMITTRQSDVATYPDSYSPVHEMHLMDDEESWNLLRQKVFKQDSCPEELEGVGMMIARNCSGLPLAIAVVSGLLVVDQTKAAWESIAKDVNKSAISANDEQCDKILSLSYTRLPHHLRACFLYMGGFPEDYKIRAVKLIRLWVAEGFVKPDGHDKSFEVTAEEYLEDLVKRSLVSVTERKTNGRIKIVGMHDLMREMCVRRAQQENFILLLRGVLGEGVHIPRRIIIYHNRNFLENLCGSTTRTIIRDNPTGTIGEACCLGQFRLLRILDLLESHGCFYPHRDTRALPAEVYELLHLRYFALDHMFKVGAAITNLHNLQTLVIRDNIFPNYTRSEELPVEIWSLRQLRHVIVSYGDVPLPSSLDEGPLENLQTFYTAADFFLTPHALKMIPNLKKLGLIYSKGKDDDYHLHNLVYLQHLEKLNLLMCQLSHVNLAFPSSLKKLSLSRVGLPWDDMGIVGSLPNLEVLKLRSNYRVGVTWETGDGQFPQLKLLEIEGSDLKHWITESCHFPRLKHLVLCRCRDLSEIPSDIGEVLTLELIEVDDQRLLASAKQIQEEQQGYGNESIQVHLVKGRRQPKWEARNGIL